MNKWIKEPLFHFMLLGAAIFLTYSLVGTNEDSDNKIVIDDDRLEHINALWEIQWKRPATAEEMQSLVENYIRQEVLYREALRMNLDHNDEVVKRRLSQKMQFLASDLTKIVEPVSEAKLQIYFEEHLEDYRIPVGYSFQHILISKENHDDPQAYAAQLLSSANAGQLTSLENKGDQTMLPLQFDDANKVAILRELGEDFYEGLDDLPLGKWVGPIHSGFGEHLIFISDKTNSRIPELAEVKTKVLRDYEYQAEKTTQDAIFNKMKKNYEVVISSEDLNAEKIESL